MFSIGLVSCIDISSMTMRKKKDITFLSLVSKQTEEILCQQISTTVYFNDYQIFKG